MKASLIPQVLLLCSGLALSDLAISAPLPHSQSTGTVLTASRPSNVLFHPSTGKCVVRTPPKLTPLKLGACNESDSWAYTPQKFLTAKGTYYCLKSDGSEKPAKLSIRCSTTDSQWNLNVSSNSDVETHMSTELEGNVLCLAAGPEDVLFTSPCLNSDEQLFEFTTKDKVQALG